MDPRHALTVVTRLAERRPEQRGYLARASDGRLAVLLADSAMAT